MAVLIISSSLLIFGALFGMYWWAGAPLSPREEFSAKASPHHFERADIDIALVSVKALYFVPANKRDAIRADWSELLRKNLERLQEFHALQSAGRSVLRFEIDPNPIIGREASTFYDTDVTQHGNPEALRRISKELEEGGYFSGASGGYRVFLILYEGVGASGSENVALVSSAFLALPEYGAVATTILAHEFYHTLGIPDGYDLTTARAHSNDIMGEGRARPIEKTFISSETRARMGF